MATEGGPGTSRKFKAFDIYKNPKNLEIAPVEDYVEKRTALLPAGRAAGTDEGVDRHPDSYFRSSYEGADQASA